MLKPLVDIPLMADKAREMLHDALDAFVRRDVEQAQAMPARDGEVMLCTTKSTASRWYVSSLIRVP